jgi:hypothetical protein
MSFIAAHRMMATTTKCRLWQTWKKAETSETEGPMKEAAQLRRT